MPPATAREKGEGGGAHLSYQSRSSCCSFVFSTSSSSRPPSSSFRSGLRSPAPLRRAAVGAAHELDFQDGVMAGLASTPAKRTPLRARGAPVPPPLPARTGAGLGLAPGSQADAPVAHAASAVSAHCRGFRGVQRFGRSQGLLYSSLTCAKRQMPFRGLSLATCVAMLFDPCNKGLKSRAALWPHAFFELNASTGMQARRKSRLKGFSAPSKSFLQRQMQHRCSDKRHIGCAQRPRARLGCSTEECAPLLALPARTRGVLPPRAVQGDGDGAVLPSRPLLTAGVLSHSSSGPRRSGVLPSHPLPPRRSLAGRSSRRCLSLSEPRRPPSRCRSASRSRCRSRSLSRSLRRSRSSASARLGPPCRSWSLRWVETYAPRSRPFRRSAIASRARSFTPPASRSQSSGGCYTPTPFAL